MTQRSCWSCFATGAFAMAVIAAVIGYAWSDMQRVTTASTAHRPLLVALGRVQDAARTGDDARVIEGLEQLRSCWEAYAFAGGEAPEQFAPRLGQPGPACGPKPQP